MCNTGRDVKRLVIDPGHGGADPGASGFGLKEKELTLQMARLLVNRLTGCRVEVLLTRNSDVAVNLRERARIANEFGADFFCSLHVNAGGGTGFESYVHVAAPEKTAALQAVIHEQLASFYGNRGFPDRGKKRADFAVLRETRMPAVLLENLFLDHPRDAASLADPAFLDDLAAALATALVMALNIEPKPQWDPAGEIARLKERGLLVNDHDPDAPVSWGEFATVMNRLLDRIEDGKPASVFRGVAHEDCRPIHKE